MTIAAQNAPRIPPSTLGLRLQQSREWRELNQLDLAAVLDVSRATVSNYERGVSTPSKLQVNAWAVACDVDVEWLKTGALSSSTPRSPQTEPADYQGTVSHLESWIESKAVRAAA